MGAGENRSGLLLAAVANVHGALGLKQSLTPKEGQLATRLIAFATNYRASSGPTTETPHGLRPTSLSCSSTSHLGSFLPLLLFIAVFVWTAAQSDSPRSLLPCRALMPPSYRACSHSKSILSKGRLDTVQTIATGSISGMICRCLDFETAPSPQ